jgi:multiple sugar transport system ATP-binding protein
MPAAAIHLFDPQGHALPRLIADTDLLLPQAA